MYDKNIEIGINMAFMLHAYRDVGIEASTHILIVHSRVHIVETE